LIGLSKSCYNPTRVKQRKKFLKDGQRIGFAEDPCNKTERKHRDRVARIYAGLFDEPFPYTVTFSTAGYCDHFAKAVFLYATDLSDSYDFKTMCHELCHVRYPLWNHGKRFDATVKKMVAKAKGIK
jgi:hypothetical protein